MDVDPDGIRKNNVTKKHEGMYIYESQINNRNI